MASGIILCASYARGQELNLNLEDHENKTYYLGIGISYNNSRLILNPNANFVKDDSLSAISAVNSFGVGLSGLHTFQLSKRFEVRAIFPQLLFTRKNIQYYQSGFEKTDTANDELQNDKINKVESIVLGVPVHVKFRSDRIGNFRVYTFMGGKVELDLSANKQAFGNKIKLTPFDYGVEAGFGFNFYFPVFILSPEIKISRGLKNVHNQSIDYNIVTSRIDQMNSRMIVFSLIFEG